MQGFSFDSQHKLLHVNVITVDYPEYRALLVQAVDIHTKMRLGQVMITDRDYGLATFKACFVAKDFVNWLIVQGDFRCFDVSFDAAR